MLRACNKMERTQKRNAKYCISSICSRPEELGSSGWGEGGSSKRQKFQPISCCCQMHNSHTPAHRPSKRAGQPPNPPSPLCNSVCATTMAEQQSILGFSQRFSGYSLVLEIYSGNLHNLKCITGIFMCSLSFCTLWLAGMPVFDSPQSEGFASLFDHWHNGSDSLQTWRKKSKVLTDCHSMTV